MVIYEGPSPKGKLLIEVIKPYNNKQGHYITRAGFYERGVLIVKFHGEDTADIVYKAFLYAFGND
jgi:hypothetical protein